MIQNAYALMCLRLSFDLTETVKKRNGVLKSLVSAFAVVLLWKMGENA